LYRTIGITSCYFLKVPGFKVQQVATKRGNDGTSVKAKDVNSVPKYLLVGL